MLSKKKQVIVAAVFISLIMMPVKTNTLENNEFKCTEKNFETPEAAIKHFIERLAANDLEGALESCNINEMDRFDYMAYTMRLQAMILYASPSPSKSPLFNQINRIMQMEHITRQAKFLIYSLLTDISEDEISKVIPNPDEAKISSFIADCDTRKLAGLTVVKINLPTSIINTERARKILLKWRVYMEQTMRPNELSCIN